MRPLNLDSERSKEQREGQEFRSAKRYERLVYSPTGESLATKRAVRAEIAMEMLVRGWTEIAWKDRKKHEHSPYPGPIPFYILPEQRHTRFGVADPTDSHNVGNELALGVTTDEPVPFNRRY